MALSQQAMVEIQNLAVEDGGNSGISLSKQQTTPNVGHLVVSMGGSGADMIRETKGLINQNCSADNDKHKAPERVAYVAFDTAANEKNKPSSKATGQVKLTDDELTILSDGGLGVLLDPATRNHNRDTYPWIYRWLDTRIPVLTGQNGAGGIRQAGRAMLFLEMGKVIAKLRTTIQNLITGTDVESLNIYLLSGISGGTGSGTFLDMAYIVRQIANEVIGAGAFKKTNVRVLGYLIMPDVNLRNANAETEPGILRNAGAALQELDHAMRLPEIGDYYECQYTNKMTIRTNKPPFEYVHLVCARAKGTAYPDFPYQHCLDTVAGSILSFVSSQKKAGVKDEGGVKAEEQFPVDSYYSNITNMQNTSKTTNTYKERSNCYISIGYACWQIPADRLVKYIFTLMFREVNDLFENEPTQNDVYDLFDVLSLGCDQKVMDFMGTVHKPLNPSQYTGKDLFGKNAMALEEYLPYEDCIREINKAFVNSIKDYHKDIQEQLQQTFVDPKKGPIWTNHVVVQGANPTIDALMRLITEEKNLAIANRAASQSAADNLLKNINRMRNTYKSGANQKKCAEYIEAWNNYFFEIIKVHCYDLLIGKTETLKNLGNEYTDGFYDEAQNITAILNNQWLDVTRQVLEELKKIVQKNTDEFRKVAVKDTGHGFQWSTGDIPNLDKAIGDIIAKNGVDQTKMMTNFLDKLLGKADEWAQSVDVRKFIEEFLETEASSVLNVSLEGLLASCFDEATPLAVSVKEELMPYMIKSARPLFDGDQEIKSAAFITIPAGCAQIAKGVNDFVGTSSEYNINTSYLRNRISVICTSVGISLHDYTTYERCEQQISLEPNAKGLFLNQGEKDFVGWTNHMKMPLPFIIPTRKRSVMSPAPERFANYEKSLVEEFREMRRDQYPFLKFVQTPDKQDYSLDLGLSVRLNESGFYDMIRKEKYTNYSGEVDSDKLRQLIEDLKEIRYGQGLPVKTDLPNRLTICENLLHSATKEMQDRYHDLIPEEVEKVKIDVAWEVAEWYYVSAYSFYMKAKEEKSKYDEISKKIDEFEKILEQLEQRPVRCCVMAKMLASDAVRYDRKFFRYVYRLNEEDVELVAIEPSYLEVKEMKLFEELERLRKGNPVEKELYDELSGRADDGFDKVLDEAYDKAYDEKLDDGTYPETAVNVKKVIELYRKLAGVRNGVEQMKKSIELFLAGRNARPTRTKNTETREFYTVYFQGIDDEIRSGGNLAARTSTLGIVDARGNLRPDNEIFKRQPEPKPVSAESKDQKPGTDIKIMAPVKDWKCPACGQEGNTMKFCGNCGATKPEPASSWKCPACGQEGNTMKFCGNCGAQKPADGPWTCPECGHVGNTMKFCGNCGFKRP